MSFLKRAAAAMALLAAAGLAGCKPNIAESSSSVDESASPASTATPVPAPVSTPADVLGGVPYRVLDYEGRTVAEGRAARDADGGAAAPFNPPAGYHEVVTDGAETRGMWTPPADAAPTDGFMSMDTALSWLTKPEHRASLIAGLPSVTGKGGLARERFWWREINPAEGKRDWEGGQRSYETTRRLYQQEGIRVLEVFHDAPGWMGNAQKGNFPDDLAAAAREWTTVARRWSGLWGGLEVWNEPDIDPSGQPADQYVSLVKTIRRAMADAGAATPLGAGVFATFNLGYLDTAARNGLLDECDFLSFHYYGDPLRLEWLVGQYRAWMEASGRGTKPLWLTEAGIHRAGVKPAADVQARTALTYAMQAVEAKACGVAHFFPFVYPEFKHVHEDASMSFGLLDKQRTPMRMLAAVAQAGRALGGLDYIGDVPTARVPGAQRIRVFASEGGGDALVAIYTGKVETGAAVKLPFAATSASGADGRELALDEEGRRVPVPDGLTYARAPRAALDGVLDPRTEAMRLWKLGHATPSALPAPAQIVLQPQINPNAIQQSIPVRGYFLRDEAKSVTVNLGVVNLGPEPRTVTVRAPGVKETEVTAPPFARTRVPLEVALAGLPPGADGDGLRIDLTATADDGSRIAPAALTVIPDVGLAGHLAANTYRFALSVGEGYRWEKQANGTLTFGHKPPAAWGFTVAFPKGVDRWAYPAFKVAQEVDYSRVTGVLARVRCLRPAVVRLISWDDRGTMSVTANPIVPADGEWHTAYVPLGSYIPGFSQNPAERRPITKISVGFNSDMDENTLEISDLYLVGN